MSTSHEMQFSGSRKVFRGRRLPETATLAGYGALIDAYELPVPRPRKLSATGNRHRIFEDDAWRILTPRHAHRAGRDDHLTFALKHEGLDLAVLKRLFTAAGPDVIAEIVRNKPTATAAEIRKERAAVLAELQRDWPEGEGTIGMMVREDAVLRRVSASFTGAEVRDMCEGKGSVMAPGCPATRRGRGSGTSCGSCSWQLPRTPSPGGRGRRRWCGSSAWSGTGEPSATAASRSSRSEQRAMPQRSDCLGAAGSLASPHMADIPMSGRLAPPAKDASARMPVVVAGPDHDVANAADARTLMPGVDLAAPEAVRHRRPRALNPFVGLLSSRRPARRGAVQGAGREREEGRDLASPESARLRRLQRLLPDSALAGRCGSCTSSEACQGRGGVFRLTGGHRPCFGNRIRKPLGFKAVMDVRPWRKQRTRRCGGCEPSRDSALRVASRTTPRPNAALPAVRSTMHH